MQRRTIESAADIMQVKERATPPSFSEPPVHVRVVWGLGTGRHIRHAARAGEYLVVFAVDIAPGDRERADAIIAARPELSQARDEGRLEIVIGDLETLRQRFAEIEHPASPLLIDMAALDAAPETLRPLVRLVERVHLEQRDAVKWRERLRGNLERNLEAVGSAPSLEHLRGAATGQPAFVLAAGPSARLAGRWLAELRRFGPLIAVDTALPLCRAAQVPIDALATVDPHPGSERHLQAGTEGVSLLAFQPYACPELVAAFPRRVLAVPEGDKLCDRLATALELPRVEASGTVLTYAIDIAQTLGCGPIVLIGADFANVGLQTHATGTATAASAQDTGLRARTTSGALVPTTHPLERFRAAVEQRIAGSASKFWAVDGGGARILGADMVSWVELAQRLAALPAASLAPDWLAPTLPPSSGEGALSAALNRVERARLVLREFDSE